MYLIREVIKPATTISSAAQVELHMGASTADPLPAPGSDSFTKIPQLKRHFFDGADAFQVVEQRKHVGRRDRFVNFDAAVVECSGSLLTNYTQTPHNTMLADVAVAAESATGTR